MKRAARASRASASRSSPTLWACAEIQIVCPEGTGPQRRVFSGGAEAEWCHRDDGVRQGLEVRYYESGAKMIEGAYLDGARFGEWYYYPNDGSRLAPRSLGGRRARRARRSSCRRAPPTSPPSTSWRRPTSLVVSLGSADPLLGRTVREEELPTFAVWYGNGKPRVLGHYDRDGFRTRTWRFWYEGGGARARGHVRRGRAPRRVPRVARRRAGQDRRRVRRRRA